MAAGVNPFVPALAATFAASFGFMLPVSTPQNAIAYGSGVVPITKMIRSGFSFDILGALLIVHPAAGDGRPRAGQRGLTVARLFTRRGDADPAPRDTMDDGLLTDGGPDEDGGGACAANLRVPVPGSSAADTALRGRWRTRTSRVPRRHLTPRSPS